MTRGRHAPARRRGLGLALLLLALALFAPPRRAGAGEIEELNPDLAAQLHLKILSYDRSLPERAHGRLVLGILYRPEREESERVRAGMQAAFIERAGRTPVQGMTLSVMPIACGDPKTLQKRLQDAGVTLLYVTPGLEDVIGAIAAAALALKVPTLTGRRSQIDSGLAVAVVTRDEKPAIAVNLPVAKALGMDLDPALLRLAEVKR
ncbi:MAG: YfiR/HmsC family protein [Polyangia bacterium]